MPAVPKKTPGHVNTTITMFMTFLLIWNSDCNPEVSQ